MASTSVRLIKPLLNPRNDEDESREARPRGRLVGYRRVLVSLAAGPGAPQTMTVACRLAAERDALVTALSVIEIPAELPLAAQMLEEEAEAQRQGSDARAIAELYGVGIAIRLRRARFAGEAIVAEAALGGSEIIVIGMPRRPASAVRGAAVFARSVDFVLKNAPCRIVVSALPPGV